MILRTPYRLLVLAFAAVVTLQSFSHGQDKVLESLLKQTPMPANSIAYVNLPALKKLIGEANLGAQIQSKLTEVRLVSSLNLRTLTPNWEIGSAGVNINVTAESLAKLVDGYVDTIADKKVVWSPRQAYLIPGAEKDITFIRPADRRVAAGYIQGAGLMNSSKYLSTQLNHPKNFLSVLLAVDLADIISPVTVSTRLPNLETAKGLDPEKISKVISSIQGLNIIIGRRSLNECILTLDFASSPADLQPIAGKMLAEILANNGSEIPEIAEWAVTVKGNSLALQGPISAGTLESLLGIFSIQHEADQMEEQSTTPPPSPGQETTPQPSTIAQLSKAYFTKINMYVNRARDFNKNNTGQRALWNDQIARNIDNLGTLNVDTELVGYSSEVANMLRSNSLEMRKFNMQAANQRSQIATGNVGLSESGVGMGTGGFYGMSYWQGDLNQAAKTTAAQQSTATTAARTAGLADFRTIMAQIDSMTADMKKKMTDKYQIQF